MTYTELKAMDDAYVLHTYGRFPLALEKGENATCWDFEGKKYIDFTSGIGVNSFGFADPVWAAAVAKQASTLQHASNLYYTEPCAQLAKKLCEKSGMKKVFFANSGAEANEGAIKTARKYSFLKYGKGRSTILPLVNSFHGRTVTTLAATGQDVFHNYFFPFTEGFTFAKANDIADLEEKLTPDVCAVMMELVQGEGGVIALDKDYVKRVERLCREKDVLLLIDEVQTGVGRTGTFYAYQQYGIKPDVVTSAKGIGGGLPLAAVLFSDTTETVLTAGDHATTFGGNPVACAGGNTVLDRMDEAFFKEVREKAAYMREKLSKMPHVTDVSGLGLMIGVSLDEPAAKDVVLKGIENGIILLTAKKKIRLLPPLTIRYDEIDEGLGKLEYVLSSL